MRMGKTKKAIQRRRRVLRLQRRTVHGATERGGARSIHYLAVPTDFVLGLGLEPGDRFRVHEIGGVLMYEHVGPA